MTRYFLLIIVKAAIVSPIRFKVTSTPITNFSETAMAIASI